MAITSRHGSFIKEFDVAMGDKVKEGSLVLTLEVAGDAAALQNALVRVVRFRRSRPFKKTSNNGTRSPGRLPM
jgi:multidrug efflux pump subunit AcrA (membrane-fusion protein)